MSAIGWAILGGAALTAGGGLISAGMNGGAPGIEDKYLQGPDFSQGQTATNQWANWLSSANAGNNYNAIEPDWSDIWSQTQQQVQNYFSGTATQPGVNDQIKGSFAQRGMSGDPAASYLQAASGANEAQDLGNLSAQQNIATQQFAQTGQQNWLNSLQAFQNQVANGPTGGTWTGAQPYATPGQQIGNAISGLGTAGVVGGINAASNNSQLSYLNSILNPTSTGSYASPTGFSDITMAAGLPTP